MKKIVLSSFLLVISITCFLSCKKEIIVDPNEEELITTLMIKLTEVGTTNTQTIIFKDADGTGGLPPQRFDSIFIRTNKTYTAEIKFFNESVDPAIDITPEVLSESEDHQLYFQSAGASIVISNLSVDALGLPVGLSSTWVAAAKGTGSLTITLKHKPGIKAIGDPITKGETDVEIAFGVNIQ
ncbi:MAG: hypothetical protein K9I82_01220 [Chitinophagaceae bacterium]|nr:hypothetical protein [Chitinophagaceae bacterium]